MERCEVRLHKMRNGKYPNVVPSINAINFWR
jgi:hypothetical protein